MKCYEVFGDCERACCRACPFDRAIEENNDQLCYDGELSTREGVTKMIRASVSPVADGGDRVGGIVLLEDVSVLKELQEIHLKTLRQQESSFRESRCVREERDRIHRELSEAQRIARLGSWTWNIQNDTARCSDEYFRLFGVSPIEGGFSNDRFLDLVHSDDRERVKSALARALRGETPYCESYRVLLPDGTERIHRGQGEVRFDGSGRPVEMVGIQHDITDMRLVEEELRRSEERLSLALDSVSDAVWDWQIIKNDMYYSSKWYTMLGYEPYEFPQDIETWKKLLHPQDRSRVMDILQKCLGSGESYSTDLRMRTKKGAWKWILTRGKIVEWDGDGRPVRMLGTHVDIDLQRKYQNEILREKRKTERYLNLANVMFIGLDFDGKLIIANDYACQILQCPREEIVGMDWFESFIPPENREEVRGILDLMARERGDLVKHYENKVVALDGTVRIIQWHNSYLSDEDGRFTGVLSAGNDITEKRELEKLYQSILHTSLDGFIRVDCEGRILEANRAYCRMTGYGEDELKKMSIADVENWETVEDVKSRISKIIEKGHDEFESSHIRKDGSSIDMEITVQYREEEGGQIVSFFKDITKRKKQEKDLNFQALLLDQIQDHVTATDLEGIIIYVNEAECKSLKRRRGELLGHDLETYGDNPEKGAAQSDILANTLETGEWHGEVINYDKDGKELVMDCRTRVVRDEKGDSISLVGISTDITEKKEIAERLRQSQKLKAIGSLAGGIAHDFNNILTPIVGMADFLMLELGEENPAYERARDILEAGERGADLVRQILAFSRKSPLHIIPVRLDTIIKEACVLIRAALPANISLEKDLDPQCAPVKADPTQMHQVVMNLLTNAYHAIEPRKGRINITLRETSMDEEKRQSSSLVPGTYALLRIEDDGMGMAPEVSRKIFEPYFTTKEHGKGTGLGLSVVYGIVKERKGEIFVESEPGKGTAFCVWLPLTQSPKCL